MWQAALEVLLQGAWPQLMWLLWCRYGIGAPVFLIMSLVGWWAYGDVSSPFPIHRHISIVPASLLSCLLC